jgi:hypothetical protein
VAKVVGHSLDGPELHPKSDDDPSRSKHPPKERFKPRANLGKLLKATLNIDLSDRSRRQHPASQDERFPAEPHP